MIATLALSLGTALASVFYPVGIKVMVDAFLAHDRGGVVLGAGLVAGLYALQWILSNNGATAGTTLADHVNLYLSTRIAALVNGWRGSTISSTPNTSQSSICWTRTVFSSRRARARRSLCSQL